LAGGRYHQPGGGFDELRLARWELLVWMVEGRPPAGMRMTPAATVDARGKWCPLPIIWTAERIHTVAVGEVLEVLATDSAIEDDLPAWCRSTGHDFLGFDNDLPLYRGFARRTH
jgi:tRNA 2-thiouridine synthesizing protein A